MPILALFDPASAALVLGGTLAATLARAGWGNARITAGELANLLRRPFDHAAARAALAGEVERIRHDGVLRARPVALADSELSDATAALVRHRSVAALVGEHERHRARREERRQRALGTLDQAAELGPVFGLVGTLVGLGQLPTGGLDSQTAVMAAVSTAILTTLYGLLVAHLLVLPLAGMIERRGRAEEAERARLIDWLAGQVAPACAPITTPPPASLVA